MARTVPRLRPLLNAELAYGLDLVLRRTARRARSTLRRPEEFSDGDKHCQGEQQFFCLQITAIHATEVMCWHQEYHWWVSAYPSTFKTCCVFGSAGEMFRS